MTTVDDETPGRENWPIDSFFHQSVLSARGTVCHIPKPIFFVDDISSTEKSVLSVETTIDWVESFGWRASGRYFLRQIRSHANRVVAATLNSTRGKYCGKNEKFAKHSVYALLHVAQLVLCKLFTTKCSLRSVRSLFDSPSQIPTEFVESRRITRCATRAH